MKKILLIIPDTFTIRSFLLTDVLKIISRDNKIYICSPLGSNKEFIERFKGKNIYFQFLPHFNEYKGKHQYWLNIASVLINHRWGLKSFTITQSLKSYLSKKFYIESGLKYILKKFLLKALRNNEFVFKFLKKKIALSFFNQYDLDIYFKIFDNIKPDLVISTKSATRIEYPIAMIAEKLNISQMCYVQSFDNITTNGLFPVVYDKWLVWNEINKNEVISQYNQSIKNVDICGPLQYDFVYKLKNKLKKKSDFFSDLNLDINRPMVLFAAGPKVISPNEPFILEEILLSIRNGLLPSNPEILVRLHPSDDFQRWENIRNKYPETKFSLPWEIIDEDKMLGIPNYDDILLLLDSVYHSDIIINTSSSMAIDAAYFDKPIICLAYSPEPAHDFDKLSKDLYLREHYKPITDSGAVKLVENINQTIKAINNYIENPQIDRKKRLKMLKLFDHNMDGNSDQRVSESILKFLSENK